MRYSDILIYYQYSISADTAPARFSFSNFEDWSFSYMAHPGIEEPLPILQFFATRKFERNHVALLTILPVSWLTGGGTLSGKSLCNIPARQK
jgi:hypothetical protein